MASIVFDETEIVLNPTCALFVTMEAPRAIHKKIPDNFKVLLLFVLLLLLLLLMLLLFGVGVGVVVVVVVAVVAVVAAVDAVGP